MVKSYLRYSEGACLGVVCSGSAVEYDASGDHAIVAALSSVIVWNLRTGVKLRTLHLPVLYVWVGVPTFLGLFVGTTFARAP